MNKKDEHQMIANILHALGHPIRYCIAEGLCDGERDVSTMVNCLDEPQPKISQHLNILKAAGIIEGRRVGAHILYSIKNPVAIKVIKTLKQ